MKPIKIAVVDDHHIFREGLRLVLQQINDLKIVYDTHSGKDFLEYVQNHPIDVALVDILMPEITGIELTQKLMKLNPDLKIIALTMFSDLEHYSQMMTAGALGFLVKSASKEELHQAIKIVYDGGNYFSQEILKKLSTQSVYKQKSLQKSQLTPREKEILKLLCSGKTTFEISEHLFISFKTVETHRTNIFKKTGVHNIAELIIWAIKHHYYSVK